MEKIIIENDITRFTLKKIYKTQSWFSDALDEASEYKQFMENIDNGFVCREALELIVNLIFKERNKGGFRKSLGQAFGTRAKIRFIASKLEELLK